MWSVLVVLIPAAIKYVGEEEIPRAFAGDDEMTHEVRKPLALYRAVNRAVKVKGSDGLIRALAPGSVFRDCDQCPEMVVVPAGRFRMGDLSGDPDQDERPVHEVTIADPLAVGQYEVTKGEFERFVEATGYEAGKSCWTFENRKWEKRSGYHWRNPGFTQTDQHPVVCVNWDDAQEYVSWLSRETGKSYRLLSEAEWEYVARAGTQTAWYWGESESGQCRYANGADLKAKRHNSVFLVVECDDGYYWTSPAGNFEANAFGLFDLAGNAWEWVEDCWIGSYEKVPKDGSAWTNGNCGFRVLRGGSWSSSPGIFRSAFRGRNDPGNRYDLHGFRVARTLK